MQRQWDHPDQESDADVDLELAELLDRVSTAMRRLGFWLERLKLGEPALLKELASAVDRNYARLDPGGPADGPRDTRWRLIVNVPARQLLEWQEH